MATSESPRVGSHVDRLNGPAVVRAFGSGYHVRARAARIVEWPR